MEVVVAAGLMGVTAVGMSSLYKSGFVTQKSLLARDDTRSIVSDMTSILSDATACANTFTGLNPSTGASFSTIKDSSNVARYQTGTAYGNKTVILNSLTIGGSGTDSRTSIKKWSPSGTGGVALVIAVFTQSGNSTNNGNGTGPQQLIRYFLVNVQTLSGSNILTCQAQTGALTTASEGSGTVGYLPIWQTSTSLGDSSFYKSGTDTILSSGNLGIGVSAPTQKLHITGTPTTTLKIVDGNQAAGRVLTSDANGVATWQANAGGGIAGSGTSGYIPYFSASTTLANSPLTTANGYVGVGKTNPLYTMDLLGKTGEAALISLKPQSTGQYADILLSVPEDPGYFHIGLEQSDSTNTLMLNTLSSAAVIGHTTQALQLGSNNTVRMTLDTSGNIGVGTTSPAAKLDVQGAIKFGSTASTCNATNEGQQRYNSTSKNMEFCNGTAWTAYSSGGRTSCPTGYLLIGTSGTAEAFCISSAPEASARWLNAGISCHARTPKAHLCSASEWLMACVAGVGSMTGHWEWVADLNDAQAQVMGNGGCDSTNAQPVTYSVTSRCCFR